MEENPNKLYFNYTDFNSSTHVTVHSECVCVFIKILFSPLNSECHVNRWQTL